MRKVVVALLLCLVVAGSAFAADDTIKIGFYNCLTGQNAFGGQLELEGVQLALKEHPEILGKKVELVVVDNKSDKVEAANAVTRLIESDKVCAIIGSYGSSLTMAGGEVTEAAHVPMVTTSSTNPLVTQGKKYIFRACFIDPQQGAGAATYAYKTLGYKKAATLVDVANDYAVGLATFFKNSFAKMGGEIVSEMKYASGDTDFNSQLTEIISKGPDVVLLPAYFAEGSLILKQAKDLGAEFRFMGGDAMDNPEMVTLAPEAVEGFIYTGFAYAPDMPDMNPVAAKFTESWKKEFPKKDTNANAALGYDCYIMLMDAITRAGSADPEMVTLAPEAVEGFIYTGFAYAPDMPDMNPVAAKFTESWKKEFPKKDTNANAALGYDCYIMLMDAITRAGSADPEKIRDAMETIKDLPTVTGITTLDAEHNPQKDIGILEIKNNKKTFVGTVVPEM